MRKNIVVLFLVFVFAAAGAICSTAHANNLVTDGEFLNYSGSPAAPTDWTILGQYSNSWVTGYNYVTNTSVLGGTPPPGNALSLSNYVSQGWAGVSQTLGTTVGQKYDLSLFWGDNTSNYPGNQFINVLWDSNTVTTLYTASALNWTEVSFLVTGTGSDTLALEGLSNSGYTYVADVSVSAVPLPASLMLLAPGLAALAVIRRRIKK